MSCTGRRFSAWVILTSALAIIFPVVLFVILPSPEYSDGQIANRIARGDSVYRVYRSSYYGYDDRPQWEPRDAFRIRFDPKSQELFLNDASLGQLKPAQSSSTPTTYPIVTAEDVRTSVLDGVPLPWFMFKEADVLVLIYDVDHDAGEDVSLSLTRSEPANGITRYALYALDDKKTPVDGALPYLIADVSAWATNTEKHASNVSFAFPLGPDSKSISSSPSWTFSTRRIILLMVIAAYQPIRIFGIVLWTVLSIAWYLFLVWAFWTLIQSVRAWLKVGSTPNAGASAVPLEEEPNTELLENDGTKNYIPKTTSGKLGIADPEPGSMV